ncbi:unnamed protein product [Closterium sp. NIES-64]|nr:unnamed protein product [Closterium sp. NIES-64]
MLPYLFPDLSSFTTAEDLISHLRATDTRFRAALQPSSVPLTPPSMYFTLYFLITCLPDTLSSVRDHFLALDPPALTVDDFEKHLLAAEKNILAVAAAHDYLGAEEVGAAFAPSGKRRSGNGSKGGRAGGGGGGGGGGAGGGGGGGGGGGRGVEVVEVVVGAAEALGAVEGAAAAVGEVGAVVAVVVRASSSRSSSSVSARPPLPSSFLTGMPGVGLLGVLVAAPISSAQVPC